MRTLRLLLVVAVGVALSSSRADAGPTEETIREAVDEIRDEIARLRGLPWKKRVEARVLTRDQLRAKLDEWFTEDVDEVELEKTVRALRRFGMLGETEDLLGLFKSMMAEGILAYYDPDDGHIYVVLGPALDALRPTIAHELVHAIEDQHYGLEDLKASAEDDPDRSWALECVLEGSAERGRTLWEIAHPELARRARVAEDDPRVKEGMKDVVESVPAYLILPTQFHYQRGLSFVERVTGNDYPGGMQALLRDMPATEEQVLHPGRFGRPGRPGGEHRRDHPRRIRWRPDLGEVAGTGWSLIDDETSGELDFALWFDFFLGKCRGRLDAELMARGEWCAPFAKVASEGWDGARSAFLHKEGQPLAIVSASAWDSSLDARQAAGATFGTLRARWGASFHAGDWTYTGALAADGSPTSATRRRLDYTGGGFVGRIEMYEDVVLWLEAPPMDRFEEVWEALTWTAFERDARDRWAPAAEAHPFEGADWRADDHGVAWRRPDGAWRVESATPTGARLRKSDVKVELAAVRAPLPEVFRKLPPNLLARVRNNQVEPEETTVRGRPAARLSYESGADEDGNRLHNVVLLVDLAGDDVLLLRAEAPANESNDRFAVDVEQAIDGLLVRDS